ncbi:PEP-utilizing enzyme [Streptomyces sp. NPDC096012]|uniref:PEP-utilizing enzyme n=1 Tax=Streptomyces sp. NPDC096012 TaxID=3155684 RepID=UPI00336A16F3
MPHSSTTSTAGFATEPYYPRSRCADSALHGFVPGDEARTWRLDFHFPRGILPLSHDLVADGMVTASAEAARTLPLPSSAGLECRVAGTHVYTGARPLDPGEAAARAESAAAVAAVFPEQFPRFWAQRAQEIQRRLGPLEHAGLRDVAPGTVAAYYRRAVEAHRYAWQVHFEVMYRLLLVYDRFIGVCAESGVSRAAALEALRGDDTKILATARGLVGLAERAQEAGLADVFERHRGQELYGALRNNGAAADWLTDLDAFLETYGHRCEGVIDVSWPSWREDPGRPLDLIRALLRNGHDRVAHTAAERPSSTSGEDITAGLGPVAARTVRAALAEARRANFMWWNEEHNFYIDLRAHLPVRRAGLAAGAAFLDRAEDGLLLFGEELLALCEGRLDAGELSGPVAERRAYHSRWQRRRRELPTVIGTPSADDPIIREIFGLGDVEAPLTTSSATNLMITGLGASAGVARGRARVLRSPDDITGLRQGDVLVCEATTPNWTPAFPLLAACVCDSGGALTHAAIISREYGLPCVVATGNATRLVRDGDRVEVDGGRGLVTVLSREAAV